MGVSEGFRSRIMHSEQERKGDSLQLNVIVGRLLSLLVMRLPLRSFLADRSHGRNGSVVVANLGRRGVVSEHLLVLGAAKRGAMHTVVVDPGVVEKEEDDVGEVGQTVERSVVHHLEELADARHESHDSGAVAAGSPRLADHLVLLVVDAGHVHTDGEDGVTKEGHPGKAAVQKHVRDLHANVGVDSLDGVGMEDVSSAARRLFITLPLLDYRTQT